MVRGFVFDSLILCPIIAAGGRFVKGRITFLSSFRPVRSALSLTCTRIIPPESRPVKLSFHYLARYVKIKR